jgi:hypothetical protein
MSGSPMCSVRWEITSHFPRTKHSKLWKFMTNVNGKDKTMSQLKKVKGLLCLFVHLKPKINLRFKFLIYLE